MPATKSAKKRVKQDERRRLHNRAYKSAMGKAIRDATQAVSGDAPAADESVKQAVGVIGRTCAKGVIHRNKAARKTSRLMKKLNAGKAAGAE